MKPSQIKPLSYLQSHAEELVETIASSGEPILITRNGEACVVVQDAKAYGELQQTLALLKILALGQKEIQAGNFSDTDTFFAELDAKDERRSL